MAKGKAIKIAWYCPDCKAMNYVNMYNKRADGEYVKETSKHCPHCRKHMMHRRKDVKKAAQN